MIKTNLAAYIALIMISVVPSFADSYRQVGPIEDVSYAGIKRISARIIVPDNLTREQLKQTLSDAVKAIAKKNNADAAMIYAYRPQDTPSSSYTAGMAVYAPNGEWGDAGENAAKEVSIQLGDLYFQEKEADTPGQGSKVTLTSTDGSSIGISRSRDEWTRDQIIANMPSGSTAMVLERYEKALSADFLFIRYRVRTTYNGNQVEGWVHEEEISK